MNKCKSALLEESSNQGFFLVEEKENFLFFQNKKDKTKTLILLFEDEENSLGRIGFSFENSLSLKFFNGFVSKSDEDRFSIINYQSNLTSKDIAKELFIAAKNGSLPTCLNPSKKYPDVGTLGIIHLPSS